MLAASIAALLLALTVWGVLRQRARERARVRFDALVAGHLPALRRRRRQLLRADDYGLVDAGRWEREAGYFLERVALGGLAGRDAAVVREDLAGFRGRLEAAVLAGEPAAAAGERFARVRSGQEFEHFCAGELERGGWRVALTEATGDQGADLIAERGGERLVVQCKLLGRPVGNGAVQEVAAARAHRAASRALVVSNQRFTPRCGELAAATGVELAHWSELARL